MRSFFAVIAFVFLLWMVFTWIRWDSRERTAAAARRRIRDRLVDSRLAAKVKTANAHPTMPIAEAGEESFGGGSNFSSFDAGDEFDTAENPDISGRLTEKDTELKDTIDHLREQLKQAEAKASAAQQSDLELRRLRSELQSVEVARTDAVKRVQALEERISEQQIALEQADQNNPSKTNLSKLQQDLAEREKQNEDLRKRLSQMLGTVKKTSIQTELEIGQSSNDTNSAEQASSSRTLKSKVATEQAAQSPETNSAGKIALTPLYEPPAYKDDLKLIKGIGPVMEATLNELGVTTFKQLANFTQSDIEKVSVAIGAFPGRIERDDWVGKAKSFIDGQSTM